MGLGSGPFKIIRCCDPAIDDPVGPVALRYSHERDASKLTFIEGLKPTVFHARLLDLQERRDVRNKASDADKFEAAFVRGLLSVTDLVREEGGQPIQWTRPDDKSGKARIIPDRTIEENFDEATVQEIGSVIYYRSFLARTSGQYFPLPAICRDALSATLVTRVRRVEQTSGSSGSGGTSPPAAAQPATTPTSSPDGDASTPATATG